MCGLAGFLDLGRATSADGLRTTVIRMADTLRHRGPNDAGTWEDAAAGIAMGFRRLSIIDLSVEGHQPMHSASGRYVLGFNGEVYNFEAIRRELEDTGAAPRFRGHSDTEVLLAAFEAWGVDAAVRRFAGMFAFALWDRRERRLYLGRDRLGEKPMYYGWAGSILLFGSELKALRAHPAFRGEIDRDALALFVRYSCIPAPRSIYLGIQKLPPATTLAVDATQPPGNASPVPYWSAWEATERGAREPLRGTEAECLDELDRLLRETVRQEMVADVPLGAFLSGGVDSSLIVALMQAQSPRPVKTFTIGFHEAAYNEALHAKAVAKHLGTDHTDLYLTPDQVREAIPLLPTLNDEPFADASQLPTYFVSRLAAQSVTVSLSGDGGDELFAGYSRYLRVAAVWRAARRVPGFLRGTAAGLLSVLSPQALSRVLGTVRLILPSRLAHYAAADKVHKFADALRSVDRPERLYRALLSKWPRAESVVLGTTPPEPVFRETSSNSAGLIQRLQTYDMTTYLPDDILTKVDRASMAVSLEARVPLLDHRVVEFAARVPPGMKVRDGRGKWLSRELLYRYVPRGLVDRPKMGFVVPVGAWVRGPLRAWAESLLDEGRLRSEGFFDPAPILRRWSEHLSGRRDWQPELWDVLMFQAWHQAS